MPGHSATPGLAEHATLGTTKSPAEMGVVPASYQTPISGGFADQSAATTASVDRTTATSGREGVAAERTSGHSPTTADRFAYIQDQLRRLGATYYLLESWGDEQPLYRFYCKMAIGGNAGYTRYFEATDANPLQAMAQVLREVETWRNSKDVQTDTLVPVASR
jgi:subtilase family serine protease